MGEADLFECRLRDVRFGIGHRAWGIGKMAQLAAGNWQLAGKKYPNTESSLYASSCLLSAVSCKLILDTSRFGTWKT